MRTIRVIDSHTGGEPTRVVISGAPDLGGGSVAAQARVFTVHHDAFRSCVVNEPRGSDILVGALLVAPADRASLCGVIFFNNVGTLGMCGHGTIGLATTLQHLGRIGPGEHRVETPAGIIAMTLHADGRTSVRNVPSYRLAKDVAAEVPGLGRVVGDIAWGGNWFFLVGEHGEELDVRNAERLTDVTWRIRQALNRAGITGASGAEIDHIELFGPPADPANRSRNFVLCPGKAYDRSPCGTGTSAKLACLAADGKLEPGEVWRQESILGSIFEASYERGEDGAIIPTITGRAHLTADANLLVDEADPFRAGFGCTAGRE
jgi:4-hydroxyproline epimerase